MESAAQPFDLGQLFLAIEHARSERGITWAQISRDVGVSTSTIKRFATATDAEADGALALICWLGVAPEHFVARSTAEPQLLPSADGGIVRVDMALISALPSWSPKSRASSRTTIQRLVAAAQAERSPVASLTRLSAI